MAAEYTESVEIYAELTFPSEWGLGRLKKPVVFKGSLLHLVPMQVVMFLDMCLWYLCGIFRLCLGVVFVGLIFAGYGRFVIL